MISELKKMENCIDIRQNRPNKNWMANLPTEYELKQMTYYNKDNPNYDLRLLVSYVRNHYWYDIYTCFRQSMSYIQLYLKSENVGHSKTHAVVIDIDETFMQNASFAPFTTELWGRRRSYYNRLAIHDIGAILPYMYILYEYLILKQIKPIFLTGRHQSLRQITITNLTMFGIKGYLLYMNPEHGNSRKFKNKIFNTLNQYYDIICVLNDQDEINTHNHIKFPQLYRIQ